MSFVDHHFSPTNRSYTTLDWILLSYHPDDVITISPSSLPDLDLEDVFFQSPTEEILILITTSKTHMQGEQDH